jgi:hypothetical protein
LWSLAWRDQRLGSACTDVQAGLLGAARMMLAETRDTQTFARRGYASAVLGSLAARTDLAERWLAEEPKDPDALLLAARVSAVRTAAAYRKRHRKARALLAQTADLAGRSAAAWPADPTPFVVTLALTRFECQLEEPTALPELAALEGPWRLVEQEIWPRDPHNREAGRHLLAFFGSRPGGAAASAEVALSLAERSPAASALRLLPLAAFLEYPRVGKEAVDADLDRFNRLNDSRALIEGIDARLASGDGIDGYTSRGDLLVRRARVENTIAEMDREIAAGPRTLRPSMVRDLVDLHAAWFRHRSGPHELDGVPIADVSLLARGLQLGREFSCAVTVLRYLLPYASRYPWKLDGDPGAVLSEAITECAAESHLPLPTPSGGTGPARPAATDQASYPSADAVDGPDDPTHPNRDDEVRG